jgi:hypothetical protein
MYTKTTSDILAFYIFIVNLNSLYNAEKYWNKLNSISTYQSLKINYFNQIISYLRVFPINISASLIMSDVHRSTIHASKSYNNIQNEFCYLQSFHFLTI